MISIGDSVASGEGVPDRRASPIAPAAWRGGPPGAAGRRSARRCHRSRRAANALAAAGALGEEEEGRFVSLACSGATIDVGLLGPYKGIQPDGVPEAPQLERLAALAADREVAAALVSVGANDVGFADIVTFCVFNGRGPCQEELFRDPRRPGRRLPLADYVPVAIARLARGYDRLAERLPEGIAPERVIISEYFDPTSPPPGYRKGRGCEMLAGGVTPAESLWAREQVLRPLNAEIARSAERHGWTLVEMVDERFEGHGLCAGRRQRWVTTAGESITGQGIPLVGGLGLIKGLRDLLASHKGTLHPNRAGHREIAALIEPKLRDLVEEAEP